MREAKNSEIILRLTNLRKSYGDLVAVKDLSLDIFRGEIFGFLGPNGAGKTTTISMICGLLKSDSGEIWMDGHLLREKYRECKKLMGLCPQELVIWESLTCLEQLEFTARLYDVPKTDARRRAMELLEIFGLREKKHKLAKTLSGGMKRRLNIALALVHDPQILILDEPQSGLDPQSRILVREYIQSLAKKKTVILTTHDMDEADRMAERIAIIDHGQLLVLDTSEKLKSQIGEGDILEIKLVEGQEERLTQIKPSLPESLRHLDYQHGTLRLVGVNIPEVLPALLEKLRQSDLKIEDLTIRRKTLEDVFIALTGRKLRE
ncbi:MAG: ABC transporter ATP-binding protein [Candidatus Aminicenantes bacterium]|nr:ABC transporter ATP-binding protein [Candidatus Aminicenantes bacterium]MDH5385698.1 ABC transporter ATP-binding protein [Candidatus Aminicenantes bacterium]MDH5743314.1 ABC transporter ATP-binding protein [Candidatus Aminicenantes bacterium]